MPPFGRHGEIWRNFEVWGGIKTIGSSRQNGIKLNWNLNQVEEALVFKLNSKQQMIL